MSVSVVAVVWCLLSVVVSISFWFCLTQPHWFVHDVTMTSLGVYSYCHHHDDDVITTVASPGGHVTAVSCRVYGGARFHFSELPSMLWQATCILVGAACVLSSVCAVMSGMTLCLPRSRDSTVGTIIGHVQIIAGQWSLKAHSTRVIYAASYRALTRFAARRRAHTRVDGRHVAMLRRKLCRNQPSFDFYSVVAMLAVLATAILSVCPSVHLSVTRCYPIQTNEDRIMRSSL